MLLRKFITVEFPPTQTQHSLTWTGRDFSADQLHRDMDTLCNTAHISFKPEVESDA